MVQCLDALVTALCLSRSRRRVASQVQGTTNDDVVERHSSAASQEGAAPRTHHQPSSAMAQLTPALIASKRVFVGTADLACLGSRVLLSSAVPHTTQYA